MKYALDTEFIDTPSCSSLISLAVVREDGEQRYYEFDFPRMEAPPFVLAHVIPHLEGPSRMVKFGQAAAELEAFFAKDPKPEVWAYCGAYDWYFFCRLWGGFMKMPPGFRPYCMEWAPRMAPQDLFGPAHNALNDALSLMHAIKIVGV